MNLINSAQIKRKFILLIIFSILAYQFVECGKKKKAKEILSTEEWERENNLLASAEEEKMPPSSSSAKLAADEVESFENASNDSVSFESAKNVSVADEESEKEGDELGDELPKTEEESFVMPSSSKHESKSAGELPSTSSKEPAELAKKKPENVGGKQSEFEIDDEELIIVALDFYKNPPIKVQRKLKPTDAFGLLRRCIFKKLAFRNFHGKTMPDEQVIKLQERIKKVVDEIKAGKYKEYEQKSFDFLDENKLRELFRFVHSKFGSKSLVQMQKQIFGLYIAMNNLSSEILTPEGRKFEYKLTVAQRYHLNGFIEKLFYENFETKTDNLLYRKTKWHNSKRLMDFPVSKGPLKEKINKVDLTSLFNDIVANSTKRLRKAMHKFSALFEIVFGLYLNELGVSMSRMSKEDYDTLNSTILEIMFKDIDVNKIEKKMRQLIAAGYLSNPDFYEMVREGNLERPIKYFFGKYLRQENLDRREMDRKEIWYLDSVIYEILYERVDPELNLEFGSQIVEEAQNHINEAMQSAYEMQNSEAQHWWWWNTAPPTNVVAPTFYTVDPMTTSTTFFDYHYPAPIAIPQQPSLPTYPQMFVPFPAPSSSQFLAPSTNPHTLNPAAASYQPFSPTYPQTFAAPSYNQPYSMAPNPHQPFVSPQGPPSFLTSSAFPALKPASSAPHRADAVPQKTDHEKSTDVGHNKGNISSPAISIKSYAQILKDSKQTTGPNPNVSMQQQQREFAEKGKQILEMIKPKEQKQAKIVWADVAEEEDKKAKNKEESKMKTAAGASASIGKVVKIPNEKKMEYSSILKKPAQQLAEPKATEKMPIKVETKSTFAQKQPIQIQPNKMPSAQMKPKEKPPASFPPAAATHSPAAGPLKSEDRNKEANLNIPSRTKEKDILASGAKSAIASTPESKMQKGKEKVE